MKPRKFLIVVNPAAGRGKNLEKLDRIKSEFISRSIPFDLYATSQNRKAEFLTPAAINDRLYTDLLIVGGDGTINEVINGLEGLKIPLTIIPIGTGNDTIKHLHTGFTLDYQLNTAFDGQIHPIDAGDCNGKLFLNGVGIGFDGKVVQRMLEKGKKFQGYFTYLSEVLRILLSYREREIVLTHDDIQLKKEILLMTVAKGTTFGGGFLINPYAVNNDGLLDICMVGKVPNLIRLSYVLRMKEGAHRELKAVSFYKAREVNIEANPMLVAHMDGEFIGSPPFRIKVRPGAALIRI